MVGDAPEEAPGLTPLFYRFQICVAGYIVRRIACSASPIVRYPQERADFFWRLGHLDRILIAGYADEGVSVLMRAEELTCLT
jgi:hypothetical protein